jgi:hypothetical protein
MKGRNERRQGLPLHALLSRTAAPSALSVAVLAAGALVPGLTSAASAKTAAPEDARATIHSGNVTNCGTGQNGAGIGGTAYGIDDGNSLAAPGAVVDFTGGALGGTYLDLLQVKAGFEISAVIVKGGDAYNVYLPGSQSAAPTGLGTLPWNNLRSPNNASGGPAGISHWFVCAAPASTPDPDPGTGPTDPGTGDPGDPGTGDPGTGDPGTGDPGTGDPGDPGMGDPGDPGTGDPGTGDPGTGDPGTGDPGTGDPGTDDPGTDIGTGVSDPGTTDLGTTDPGTTDPGTTDPGTTDPGTSDQGTPTSDTGGEQSTQNVTEVVVTDPKGLSESRVTPIADTTDEVDALPRTGGDGWGLASTGGLVILTGVTLVAAGRGRRRGR